MGRDWRGRESIYSSPHTHTLALKELQTLLPPFTHTDTQTEMPDLCHGALGMFVTRRKQQGRDGKQKVPEAVGRENSPPAFHGEEGRV